MNLCLIINQVLQGGVDYVVNLFTAVLFVGVEGGAGFQDPVKERRGRFVGA